VRVLLVEDEKLTARAVAEVLKKNNFATDLAYDGDYGLDCALSGIYDVIVLDIMLPRKDGFEVLAGIRKAGLSVPVILLTARDGLDDKVRGLDGGADDYLAKPFRTEELMARIRALGRRQPLVRPAGLVEAAGLVLDPRTLTLSRGDVSAELAPREARLAELLMANAGQIISKESIILKIWGYESEAEDNHAEVLVSQLRRKLAGVGAPDAIRTVRGAGYVLDENRPANGRGEDEAARRDERQ
jgi:DNA-binding response OmpR family regulator